MGGGSSKNKKKRMGNSSSASAAPSRQAPAPAAPVSAPNNNSSASPASSKDPSPRGTTTSSKSTSHRSPKKDTSNASKKPESEQPFSVKRLEEWFAKYKESDEDAIGPDGMSKFCADIGLDPEDVLLLVIAHHLNAKTMGYFTREEFVPGFQKLSIDSTAKLKSKFGDLKKELDDPNKFKDIYRFSFAFAKEPDQKILDLRMAQEMLKLILGDRVPHAKSFLKFLDEQTSYKALNMDQWMNFLEFSRTVKEDFSNYDENSAWPVLLDEYADWSKKQATAKASPAS